MKRLAGASLLMPVFAVLSALMMENTGASFAVVLNAWGISIGLTALIFLAVRLLSE